MKKRTKEWSKNISKALTGRKFSEEHCLNIASSLKGQKKKLSKEWCENVSKGLKGHEVTKETREKIRNSHLEKKFTEEHRKNIAIANARRELSEETRKKYGNATRGKKRSDEIRSKLSRTERQLVANGTHNWPGERPCNNPTERVLDLALIPVFLADTNHNFRSLDLVPCREFQLDFVSWPLHFGIEADEPDHKKRKVWDDERDKFIEDSKELDFTYRYSTEYAIKNLVDIVKKIYEFANQQREKYQRYLLILVYDERWTPYFLQMQELLKEWFEHLKDKNRFKIFRTKKREIDKQWLWLLEEECKKHDSNFAIIYRSILEKDLKLSFKNVTSLWRRRER